MAQVNRLNTDKADNVITGIAVERLCWQLLITGAFLNALLPRALELYQQQGLVHALQESGGQSLISWGALGLVLLLLHNAQYQQTACQQATHQYLPVVLALLCCIPLASISWAVLTLAGIWLGWQSKGNTAQKAAGMLLVALALRGPLSALMLNLFSGPLLTMDAWLSASLLQLLGESAQQVDNLVLRADGVNLLVLTGCSSVTNLSWALLLWLTVQLWLYQQLPQRAVTMALLIVALVVGINAIRLTLMTLSQTAYQLVHDGWGGELVNLVTLLLVLWLSFRQTGGKADVRG
ncbi:MAG: exosortase/archaeosortase family protein [Marinobacterium sp.]|nr:exosortase/archaeosortase family protein [Marinobacterium sp.]